MSRFLSEADCRNILTRLTQYAQGGGYVGVRIESARIGNVRWARNQVSTSGDVSTLSLTLVREIRLSGRQVGVSLQCNDTSDAGLKAAIHRAESELRFTTEGTRDELWGQGDMLSMVTLDPADTPAIFSQTTDQLDADRRAAVAQTLTRSVTDAGMLSAGYLEVSSRSRAVLDNVGHERYFQWTFAQYSVTVRDPRGTGSGWAGMDHHDWGKIDAPALSHIALEKCLTSRNPLRAEPGRYTVILEPQAVCDIMGPAIINQLNDRGGAETTINPNAFHREGMQSKIGQKIVDERLSVSTDPMDPELGYVPWYSWGNNGPYSVDEPAHGGGGPDNFLGMTTHAITWIERGVLTNLSYDRSYATHLLRRPTGAGGSSSFRMSVASGPTASIEDMIASTERGLLVTRFDALEVLNYVSGLTRGCTRDGLWLIEHGKISRPVVNMMFLDSPFYVLNKIEQLGVPRRVFRPPQRWVTRDETGPAGVIVPAIKATDFNFFALSDAI